MAEKVEDEVIANNPRGGDFERVVKVVNKDGDLMSEDVETDRTKFLTNELNGLKEYVGLLGVGEDNACSENSIQKI